MKDAANIDHVDVAIIRASQAGLAMVQRPFQAIAEMVGATEAEVIARLASMKEAGVVRRIAAVPNHYSLGLSANGMSVWDIDDSEIDRLGPAVGQLDFVTHCYRRPRIGAVWHYNLFAMVHGRSRDEANEKVAAIARLLGPAARSHDVLFSTRILKKTGFRLPA